MGGASPASAGPEPSGSGFAITYRVSGSAGVTAAEIQYLTASGAKVVLPSVGLPWSYSFRTPTSEVSGANDIPADQVGVYVESPMASEESAPDAVRGLFTCQIWANGKLIEQETRDGHHVATCFTHDNNDQVEE